MSSAVGVLTSVSVLLLCLRHAALADEECEIADDDFCKCSTGNLTLDLRRMGLSFPVTTSDAGETYDYTYTPCEPVVCGSSGDAASVLCQVRRDTKTALSVGRYDDFRWTVKEASPLQFEIYYGGGDKAKSDIRSSVVSFLASSGPTVFRYEGESENLTYFFDVIGSGVRPQKRSGSSGNIAGPIGITIIALAVGGLVTYCVVGGVFMYTQRGARGLEVVPHSAFWRDLPFLIKDGFLFVISPVYKREKYQGL
jgi:hypothetical protein